jgi:hypothetical protein
MLNILLLGRLDLLLSFLLAEVVYGHNLLLIRLDGASAEAHVVLYRL